VWKKGARGEYKGGRGGRRRGEGWGELEKRGGGYKGEPGVRKVQGCGGRGGVGGTAGRKTRKAGDGAEVGRDMVGERLDKGGGARWCPHTGAEELACAAESIAIGDGGGRLNWTTGVGAQRGRLRQVAVAGFPIYVEPWSSDCVVRGRRGAAD